MGPYAFLVIFVSATGGILDVTKDMSVNKIARACQGLLGLD